MKMYIFAGVLFALLLVQIDRQSNRVIDLLRQQDESYYCKIYASWKPPFTEVSFESTDPRKSRKAAELDSLEARIAYRNAIQDGSLDSFSITIVEDSNCIQCNNNE